MGGFLASAGVWAYPAVFGLALGETSAFLGLAVPGETFLLAAGALAERGDLSVVWLMVIAAAGALIGDNLGYALGRRFSGTRPDGSIGRLLSSARMRRAQRFFVQHGKQAVFLGRFIGFVRPLTPFAAGVTKMRWRTFAVYDGAGAIIWGAGTIAAGFFMGAAAERIIRDVGMWGVVALLAAGVSAFVIYRRRRHLRGA